MAVAATNFPPSSDLYSRCRFVAGPTAVGKSEAALGLAERIGGEIISVDSMQVYRGLDIGTAKPSLGERARVPHHLVDVCDLHASFDAARFVWLAEQAVAEILARGRTPVFCGGTGLYFKALLEGLGEAPAANSELRTELEAASLASLLDELRERDPAAYGKIDRQNPRRVIRAVEVIRLTGKPFSTQKSRWSECSREPLLAKDAGSPGASPRQPAASRLICFTRASADLHARINSRVDEMFSRGLVDETRELLKHGLAENKFAMQAIGYRQVVEHLRGERDLAGTIELVKVRTRQFARRQLTWFRRHGNCHWLQLNPGDSITEMLSKITTL